MRPDEVRSVGFHRGRFLKPGYDEQDVDILLDCIEETLRGNPKVTLDELRTVTFRRPPFGKRGYRKEEVQAFLDRVIAEWPATRPS